MAMIHITRGTTALGTFSEEEVREGLRTARFIPTDLGWREGMSTWEPLSRWPEFAADATPAPAAPSTGSTTVPAVAPAVAAAAPRSGLPWDERQTRGFFNAFFETLMMVLTKPALAFNAMKREGGFLEPLLYALIGGTAAGIVHFLFSFGLHSMGVAMNQDAALLGMLGFGLGSVFVVLLLPVLIAIGAFIWSGLVHLCLMLVGGAKQPFETTFRVICFTNGSVSPLQIIPFCGGLISLVWAIVLNCIGIARAHETDMGRAVLAVLLPVFVCCGGGVLLFTLGIFGAASAISNH